MNRNKKCLIALLFLGFGFIGTHAQYDFSLPTESGQMLYYQILGNGDSVCVTHPEKEWPYYTDNKPVGELIIPDSVAYEGKIYQVVEIGANAFYRCDSLTGVYARYVHSIGTQAFYGCTSLQKYDFRCLRSIGEGAFAYCRSLVKVELNGCLEYLGISAFSMCTGLQGVAIHPDCDNLWDETTFFGCPLMKGAKKRKKEEKVWSIWSVGDTWNYNFSH